MKEAIVFQNGTLTSIITTKEELIKEINHYQCWWLSNVGFEYSNKANSVKIKVKNLTDDDRHWLSVRMR